MNDEAVGIRTVILSNTLFNGIIAGIRHKDVQITRHIGIVWFQSRTIRYLEIPSSDVDAHVRSRFYPVFLAVTIKRLSFSALLKSYERDYGAKAGYTSILITESWLAGIRIRVRKAPRNVGPLDGRCFTPPPPAFTRHFEDRKIDFRSLYVRQRTDHRSAVGNHGDTAQAPVSWASDLNCDYPFLLSIIRNAAMSAATTAAAAQATTSTLLSSPSSTTIGGNGT